MAKRLKSRARAQKALRSQSGASVGNRTPANKRSARQASTGVAKLVGSRLCDRARMRVGAWLVGCMRAPITKARRGCREMRCSGAQVKHAGSKRDSCPSVTPGGGLHEELVSGGRGVRTKASVRACVGACTRSPPCQAYRARV